MDVGERLRAQGRRMTTQRQRVLDAVTRLSHCTPEQVVVALAGDGGPHLPASTVYRALETLEQLGAIDHTHLDHGAPSYHLSGHADHVHLVCRECGRVDECPAALAEGFVSAVRQSRGFAAEITHMAVHGRCEACSATAVTPSGAGPGASDEQGHPHHELG